ncbi:uncharacterized protein LOC128271352 isoform X2 [Anopheles cruzii]|uniref:uncharacterized protein LOC128271352 isoform X2 n=1 Tax=Anopheles cruzii TaxID=68878 RepID=UPI0022EC8DB0|nr:uncharacterized protein LOC128271352 isoform X2 [Anopheles cruzii]
MLIRQIVMGRHAIEQVYIVKSLECGLYTEEAAIEEKVVLHNECLEQEVVPKSELVCDSPEHEPSSSIKLTGMNEPCRTDIEDDSSSAIDVVDYERQNHVENSATSYLQTTM